MNESYECKNQNRIPEDVMEEMLGGKCQCGKQKGGESAEEMEWRYQNVKNQNEDLRKRIAQLKGEIGKLEQEIRNQDSEDGDDMIRLIRKLSGTDAAEIQVTVRMKNYYDD